MTLVTSIAWMVVSVALFMYLDFGLVALYEEKLNHSWLYLSFACGTVVFCIGIFHIFWLTYFKKINPDEWEVHNPALVPIATACAIVSFIAFNVAFWPKYSFLTPLIGFIFTMGFVSLISLFPDDGSSRIPKSLHQD
ncbi:hypothetical protein Ciccas_000261 [Cichlidogyrus casuarinus]|uniref:Uncharacterized protein n=1 Tax=Cichlidogyrus casuarinus TaxID=1844966 RepID=A0ABD2QNE4_9PLAT